MVAVKNLARGVYAGPLLRLLAPGHFHAGVEIVAQHTRLGAAERLLGELVHIFQQLALHFFAQVRLANLLAVLVEFFVLPALTDLVL